MPDDPKKLSYAYNGVRGTLGIVLGALLFLIGIEGAVAGGHAAGVFVVIGLIGLFCVVACIWTLRRAKQGRAKGVNPPR